MLRPFPDAMAARTADLAERCKTVRTLIVDERATESSDRLRRDPRSKLIGQADQPEVREKSWIEPKKEPDKFFCDLSDGHFSQRLDPSCRVFPYGHFSQRGRVRRNLYERS